MARDGQSAMDQDLRNAPVIEIWVEFGIVPSDEGPEWSYDTAEAFFASLGGEYTAKDVLHAAELVVRGTTGDFERPPQLRLERMRGPNRDEDRWVQIGRTVLVSNLVRKGTTRPRYSDMRPQADSVLRSYIEFFKPAYVASASLHYRDIVMIPREGRDEIDPNQYFNISLAAPREPLGPMTGMQINLAFAGVNSGDRLDLQIENQPPDLENELFKFRFDWGYQCGDLHSLEPGDALEALDRAHNHLWNSFRSIFTEKCWKLFA